MHIVCYVMCWWCLARAARADRGRMVCSAPHRHALNCLCAPRSIHVAESPRDWVGGLGGWDGGGLGDRCWSGTEVLLKISNQFNSAWGIERPLVCAVSVLVSVQQYCNISGKQLGSFISN